MDFLYTLTITTAIIFILSFISNIINFFSIPLFIIGGIIFQSLLNDRYFFISLPAQIGLLLLLFYIGFEVSPIRYLKNVKKVLFDGLVDFFISFVLPLLILSFFTKDIKLSFFLSALLYITSSAINLKIIVDLRFTIFNFAEKAINISLFQDIVVSILIIILPLLFVKFNSTSLFLSISHIFIFVVFIAILYLVLKYTKDFINNSSEETIIILAFSTMIFASYISNKLINSEVMGAFLSGSILKAINYRIDIKKAFAPIKDIFSPFFFFYFGLNINIGFVFNYWLIIFIVAISIISKYLVSYIFYQQKTSSSFRNLLFGLLTIRGEFSIVLASISFNYLDEKSFSLVSAISTTIIFVNILIGLVIIKVFDKKLKIKVL